MVTVKTSKRQREGAVDRIRRGDTTVEEEARRLRVKPRAIRRFVTLAANGQNVVARPLADSGVAESSESDRDDPRLAQALKSAGIGDDPDSVEPGGVPSENGEPVPAPSPEQVVATAAAFRSMALGAFATWCKLDPGDPKVQRVCAMSEEVKASLLPWAPYVAQKIPAWLQGAEDSGAYVFVGFLALSTWNATGELRSMLRRSERVIETQAGIGQVTIPKVVPRTPDAPAEQRKPWERPTG